MGESVGQLSLTAELKGKVTDFQTFVKVDKIDFTCKSHQTLRKSVLIPWRSLNSNNLVSRTIVSFNRFG